MRIDINQSVALGVERETNKSRVARSSDGGYGTADRASLRSDSFGVSSLRERLMDMPDIRQERVSALRSAIESGTYTCDAYSTASAMVSEFRTSGGRAN